MAAKPAKVIPSPAMIQPIDPFQFCEQLEPVLKARVESKVAEKDFVFKRSPEEQVRTGFISQLP